MPFYEYACDPCLTIFKARHGINEPAPGQCPTCGGGLRKVISAPSLNTRGYSSPTEAKYAKLSESDEFAKEGQLQKIYQSIWIPPEVKHSPWDHHD